MRWMATTPSTKKVIRCHVTRQKCVTLFLVDVMTLSAVGAVAATIAVSAKQV